MIPAWVGEAEAGVVMEKTCPDHGHFQAVVCSDLATYTRLRQTPRKVTKPCNPGSLVNNGCPNDCGLCPSHDQHTCLAIIEIVSNCDLQCPVCLADSPLKGQSIGLPVLASALKSLISSEGGFAPLQIGGGEPTLHPDLVAVIQETCRLGFTKIEMDTNGLALARDPDLAERLREAGLTSIYLQMDGMSPKVSQFIRGKDLVKEKHRAIENCKKAGLEIILSATVIPGVNDQSLWEMIQFGVTQGLTGINFQAIALSGRFPEEFALRPDRFTPGHFMQKVEEQSNGKLLARDFTPISCPDPRCGLMTYLLVKGKELIPLSRILAENKLVDLVADQSDWDTVIQQMFCDGSTDCACQRPQETILDLGSLFVNADFFSVGYHGMMDVYTFDLERAGKCCVHELTWDGRLIPFCLYNIKYRSHRHH